MPRKNATKDRLAAKTGGTNAGNSIKNGVRSRTPYRSDRGDDTNTRSYGLCFKASILMLATSIVVAVLVYQNWSSVQSIGNVKGSENEPRVDENEKVTTRNANKANEEKVNHKPAPKLPTNTRQAETATSAKVASKQAGTATPTKVISRDSKSTTSRPELPEEVKNFKPTYQKKMPVKRIFADGRRIPPIELLPQKKSNSTIKVYLFDDFLSENECNALMGVHDKHVKESSKIGQPIVCFDSIRTLKKHLKQAKKGKLKVNPSVFTTGTMCLNTTFSSQFEQYTKSNWSYSTAFYPGENRFSKIFADRVQEATGLVDGSGGKFQITSYPTGIGYKRHTDCTLENQDERDRFATILVYLKDVEKGGETKFPDLGIWVKPKKGRALVWTNMDENGKCQPDSLHDASIVETGQKYILQRWYYYKSFYSLGKRPPEPNIPARVDGTSRVSCDEYEHGSCRWYDEWNYDHILEYRQTQHTLI